MNLNPDPWIRKPLVQVEDKTLPIHPARTPPVAACRRCENIPKLWYSRRRPRFEYFVICTEGCWSRRASGSNPREACTVWNTRQGFYPLILNPSTGQPYPRRRRVRKDLRSESMVFKSRWRAEQYGGVWAGNLNKEAPSEDERDDF